MAALNLEPEVTPASPEIDVAGSAGHIKDSSLKKVLKLIEEYPDRTIEIIRGWLH